MVVLPCFTCAHRRRWFLVALLLTGCASVDPSGEDDTPVRDTDQGQSVETDRGDGTDDLPADGASLLDASEDTPTDDPIASDGTPNGDVVNDAPSETDPDTGSNDARDTPDVDDPQTSDGNDLVAADLAPDGSPQPCRADRDCVGAATTCVLETREDTLEAFCREPVGGRGPGGTCSLDAQCASRRCLFEDFCLGPCVDNTDCPEVGQTCGQLPWLLDDGGTIDDLSDDVTAVASVCLPALGTLTRCLNMSDCLVGTETCGLTFDGGLGVERRCMPRVGGLQDETCSQGTDCQTGACLAGGFCYWACDSDADCGAERDCTPINFGVAGDSAVAPGCVPTCRSSGDCAVAEVCAPLLDDDTPYTLVQLCTAARGTTENRDSGALCTSDNQCRSGDCFDFGGTDGRRCLAPCDFDAQLGCAAGTRCYADKISVPFDHDTPEDLSDDTSFAFSSCLPDFGSYSECARDSDCPSGETCVATTTDQTNTTIVPRCIDAIGIGQHGASCTLDSDCASGFCRGATQCIGVCTDVSDCAPGSSCRDTIFILNERDPDDPDDDVEASATICR